MLIHGVELLDTNDSVVLSYKRSEGSFEDSSVEFWKNNIVKGEVTLDIGAYTGLYAIIGAQKGAISHAYEPVRNTFDRMVTNCTINSVDVLKHQYAIGKVHGYRTIYFSNKSFLNSAASVVKCERGIQSVILCKNLLAFDERVCCIKIDVEGAELEVLEVLKHIIKKDKPHMVIEALTDLDEELICRYLTKFGYSFQRADKKNILCTPF